MEKIKWSEKITNEEVLMREEETSILLAHALSPVGKDLLVVKSSALSLL